MLAAARRIAVALAVAAGLWLLASAFVGGPAAPAPTVPPVTTAYDYIPQPAGPPNPAWPVGECTTP